MQYGKMLEAWRDPVKGVRLQKVWRRLETIAEDWRRFGDNWRRFGDDRRKAAVYLAMFIQTFVYS